MSLGPFRGADALAPSPFRRGRQLPGPIRQPGSGQIGSTTRCLGRPSAWSVLAFPVISGPESQNPQSGIPRMPRPEPDPRRPGCCRPRRLSRRGHAKTPASSRSQAGDIRCRRANPPFNGRDQPEPPIGSEDGLRENLAGRAPARRGCFGTTRTAPRPQGTIQGRSATRNEEHWPTQKTRLE